LLADETGERDRKPKSVVEPETGEVRAEARLGRCDPKVSDQSETQTAADRRALNRRHDRFARREDPDRLVVQMTTLRVEHAAALAVKVGAGTKVLALRAEQRDAAVDLGVERLEGVGDRGDHLARKEVVGRAPNLDGCNVVLTEVDCDVAEACKIGHESSFQTRPAPAPLWRPRSADPRALRVPEAQT
jgi:hypothetical protein